MVVAICLLAVAVFFLVRLTPGDPAVAIAGIQGTGEQIEGIRADLGLDKPIGEQFTTYVGDLASGDLGKSFGTQQPVTELIRERAGTSVELALAALLLVLLVSVPLGMLMAALTRDGRRRRLEVGFMGATSGLGNVPDYVTGTILVFIFAVQLEVLPVAGAEGLQHLILPAIAVSVAPVAIVSRMVRLETLNVLAQDYMRTARSKRLPSRVIFLRHALPNVLTAALTLTGIIFTAVIGGVVVVESIFNRSGLGSALVDAVLTHDYPTVQGITLTLGILVIIVSTIVDIILALLDPRSLTRRS